MNVILIVSDTFRRDHLSFYGNKWISTPHLEKFAKYSCVFDNAYIASFPTVPNRHDLMTGRYTFTYSQWAPLPSDEVVLSEFLGEKKYVSMLIADTPHILKDGYNYQRGFTGWVWIRGQENDRLVTDLIDIKYPAKKEKLRSSEYTMKYILKNATLRKYEEDYWVAQTMNTACKWLEKNYKHKKFFLYIDTFDPHEPWDPPHWYVDMYDRNYRGEEIIYPVYGYADYLTKREIKHIQAHYAGEVTMVDRWIGRVLEKIEDLGLLSNTAVIFTTDHGFLHGEHNIMGKSIIKNDMFGYCPLYEEISHIPLVVYIPGIKHKRISALVQPPDVTATILELCGIKKPSSVQGISFLDIIKSRRKKIRDITVSAPTIIYGPNAGNRITICDGKWSFIYPGDIEKVKTKETETKAVDGLSKKEKIIGKIEPELYYLPKDPHQKKNIFKGNREVAKLLHQKFYKFLKSLGTSEEILHYWETV